MRTVGQTGWRQELRAWENQCDPRLPLCLAEAVDKLQHLRECRRCRLRDDWY